METHRWYMLNKMGMATLCLSEKDAKKEARAMDMAWPHMGPHRAVQLVEAADVDRALRATQPAVVIRMQTQAKQDEALIRQMRNALSLPCDRWNATQSRIVREAIDAADAWLEGN